MHNRNFPRENKKKMNQIIRDLKSKLSQKDKEIKFLHAELENIVKPVRERKPTEKAPTREEWRRDFLRRFKKDVLGEKG